MPTISTTDDLANVAKIAEAAFLVATHFPTLSDDEQITLAFGLATGTLTYCDDCGHIVEAATRCTICDGLADATAAAMDNASYSRHATNYNRF